MLILKPKEENYIYSYNFLPVEYFLTIVADNAEIRSNMFCFDKSWGRSVSLKLKKERKKGIGAEYLDDYVYIRIDVEQTAHCFVLNLKLIDEHINFPIYIENSTPYLLKISENGDSFQVKAKTRVPFSWSNLINNKHEL